MSPKPKVICLGMGRTGTLSLMAALNMLGFGPCYHMSVLGQNRDVNEVKTWINISKGLATIDDLRNLLKDYNSVTDYPAAMHCDKLYEAYPDAKFILTTRDPAKWEVSMRNTILQSISGFLHMPNPDEWWTNLIDWFHNEMLARHHQGRLYTDPQGELLAHNQRVIQTIPADKLLIYEINQGWDPLVKFLGVEKPETPFPHLNDTADFHQRMEVVMKN